MTCKSCNAPVLPHRACAKCGAYGSRTVKRGMDEVKKAVAKTKKTKKAKPEAETEAKA